MRSENLMAKYSKKAGLPIPLTSYEMITVIMIFEKNIMKIHGSKHAKNGMGHEDCVKNNTRERLPSISSKNHLESGQLRDTGACGCSAP